MACDRLHLNIYRIATRSTSAQPKQQRLVTGMCLRAINCHQNSSVGPFDCHPSSQFCLDHQCDILIPTKQNHASNVPPVLHMYECAVGSGKINTTFFRRVRRIRSNSRDTRLKQQISTVCVFLARNHSVPNSRPSYFVAPFGFLGKPVMIAFLWTRSLQKKTESAGQTADSNGTSLDETCVSAAPQESQPGLRVPSHCCVEIFFRLFLAQGRKCKTFCGTFILVFLVVVCFVVVACFVAETIGHFFHVAGHILTS